MLNSTMSKPTASYNFFSNLKLLFMVLSTSFFSETKVALINSKTTSKRFGKPTMYTMYIENNIHINCEINSKTEM